MKLIEDQVEETSQKLKADFDLNQMIRKKSEKHEKLEEQRKEYEYKMNIIAEIKREKQQRDQEEKEIREIQMKKEMK